VQPDGRKTLGRCPESQPIGEAYARHLVYLSSDHYGKRKRDEDEGEDEVKRKRICRQMEELGMTPRLKQDPEKPKLDHANPDQKEPRYLRSESNSESTDQARHTTDASIAAASALTTTQSAPQISVAFYLHHPSLPSKHPVLIQIPPDSILATALTNRLVLEFPTIYVLQRQLGDKLPEGFITEEDFFATAKKEVIKELVEGEHVNSGVNAPEDERGGGLEEGEVDQRRLVEVLGKDLRELTATV